VSDTHSPYASPAFLVPKADGTSRCVVDFRRLNLQTKKEHYPLPLIDEMLARIGDAKIFISLDLMQGYLQIPIHPDSKEKTAFITPDETGQFERMIFGLTNAPSVFQRLMNTILSTLPKGTAMAYLDDILIPAIDWPHLISKLKLSSKLCSILG